MFSHAVMSNSLWPQGLQHARPPCPSPSPGVCPSSCPLHWWCHSAISPSNESGDQNTGALASASVLPMSQFSHSVMSDSLQSHGLQHARLPCPSLTSGACSNLCPSSQWCHPTISSSIIPFSSCLQSFPASESFPMSQFFASGGQSIGVSASASVFPMNIQDWFPSGWTVGSSCSPRDSQESSLTPQFKSVNSSVLSFLYGPNLTSIHDYWKNHSFD